MDSLLKSAVDTFIAFVISIAESFARFVIYVLKEVPFN